MTALTQKKNHQQFLQGQDIWLFAYGSIIFKVDFPYLEKRPATIKHWQRRFWQGSHDHRGTQTSPGRVVTLIEQPGSHCKGMAFKVNETVFEHLDHREKNGYLRIQTPLHFDDGQQVTGLVYVAHEENEAYLGRAHEQEIAQQIAKAQGPSGANSEYLLELANALRQLGEHDEHVFLLEKYLLEIIQENSHQ